MDSIAQDLEQLVFQVKDALISGKVPNHSGNVDNLSIAVDDEVSGSKDIDEDDILPADWSSKTVLCPDSDDDISIESDRSWRL